MKMIDLRSDTVTRPTAAMYEAMNTARLGDDVLGDDVTVSELEALGAEIFDKESALFVPSGTMSNLIAIIGHTGSSIFPELIVGKKQHILAHEVGGAARLAHAHTATVDNQADGTMRLEDIQEAIRTEDQHHPTSTLLCLENTILGMPLDVEYIGRASRLARKNGLKVHIDGARIFNAQAALGKSVSELCRPADSVSCCLSKGLGSPVGSLLVGKKSFIETARRTRKALGGGMRQAGVLAACGLVSLREIAPLLGEDHLKADQLAQGLSVLDEISVDLTQARTNMVFFKVKDSKGPDLIEVLKREYGVLVGGYSTDVLRAVTHYDVSLNDIDTTLEAFRSSLKQIFNT